MTTKISAEETARRHGQAVVDGNMAQVMADLTPEAMAKLGGIAGSLQGVTAYEIAKHEQDGEDHVFDITYSAAAGPLTVRSRWREMGEDWKVVDAAPA